MTTPTQAPERMFAPPAEDKLHIAICNAVQTMQTDRYAASDILRQALIDYQPTKLTRTELIRIQQRSGSGDVTAVMVSPDSSPVAADAEVVHWQLKAGVAEAMCGAETKGARVSLLSDYATCEKCKAAVWGYQCGRAYTAPASPDAEVVAKQIVEAHVHETRAVGHTDCDACLDADANAVAAIVSAITAAVNKEKEGQETAVQALREVRRVAGEPDLGADLTSRIDDIIVRWKGIGHE